MDSKTATTGSHSPQRIALSYNNANSDQSALRLVFTLRPEWQQDAGPIEIVRFTDGITNTLLKVIKKTPGLSIEQIDDDAILMRAYGNNTDILIDRNREAQSHALLAEQGLAPALLARFNNGLLYKFIQGRVCTPQDLIREPIWRGVARRLAEWHARLPINTLQETAPVVNGDGSTDDQLADISMIAAEAIAEPRSVIAARSSSPNIWCVMEKWVLALPTTTEAEKTRKVLLGNELERSFNELDSKDGLGSEGLVLGHCDLLSANVIMLPPARGSSKLEGKVQTVSFIDYEYAIPCPAAFDIANHFAEWGGYDCDYNMLPTKSTRNSFLEEYLDAYQEHSKDGAEHTETLQRLAEDVDRYRGMPGLYWGIWALIQATISQIDFDYASYAEVRLGEYWAWREETDGIREKEGKEMPLRESRWAQEA